MPVVGHEQPEDIILTARRKIFPITVTDTDSRESTSELGEEERLPNTLSLASVGDTEFSPDNSPVTDTPHQPSTSSRRRVVSFAKIQPKPGTERSTETTLATNPTHQLPSLSPPSTKTGCNLIRARLVSKTSSRHIFVVSFARIICDFWSSCLFMQQVADLYSRLEKAASYRPSLVAKKLESKRQEVACAYERERRKGRRLDAATRLIQKRKQTSECENTDFVPMFPAKLKFAQVGQRERQLLMMLSRDRLLAFWEGVVTATIKRERGLNRTKVVPPVRIPVGLGEMLPVSSHRRPQTSRLRPLTASRARPVTARRQGGGGGVFGEAGFTREALLGPKTSFHFIKVRRVWACHVRTYITSHCCLFPLN